jgi:hypothetical protein
MKPEHRYDFKALAQERAKLLDMQFELVANINETMLLLDIDSGANTNRQARINDIRIARERLVEVFRRLLEIQMAANKD